MSSIQWWRSWHGAPTDHKWAVISARSGVKVGIVSAIVWALFDHASQSEDRGDVSDFDTETYAVYSGFSEDEIKAVIQAMNDKGVIQDGRLTAWDKRQPKSESEIERVTKYRQENKVKQECYGTLPVVTENYTDKDKDLRIDKDKEDINTEKPALLLFTDRFGKFLGGKELKRWLVIVDAVGEDQADTIAEWAAKKEIHLDNRPGLVASMETAAKTWREKQQPKTTDKAGDLEKELARRGLKPVEEVINSMGLGGES